jgi:hypothetical protein
MVSFYQEKANPTIMDQREKSGKSAKGDHVNMDLDISKVGENAMPL